MIDKPYAYHKPSDDGKRRIDNLREAFSATARAIDENCTDPRRKAIAITQNEQAAMWAIKAVVFGDPASVEEKPAE